MTTDTITSQPLVYGRGGTTSRPVEQAPFGLAEVQDFVRLHGFDPADVAECWFTLAKGYDPMLLQLQVYANHPNEKVNGSSGSRRYFIWDGPSGEQVIAAETRIVPLVALPGGPHQPDGLEYERDFVPWLAALGLSTMGGPVRLGTFAVTAWQIAADEGGQSLLDGDELRHVEVEIPWRDNT
jgi:hypothetical protein